MVDLSVTTFPTRGEWARAAAVLEAAGAGCQVVSPDPGFARVGVPALIVGAEARAALHASPAGRITFSGWVDHYPIAAAVPPVQPPGFAEDIFGTAAIMLLARCIADETKIRIIAHISGDMSGAFPLLNAELPAACYNPAGPTFTYMDRYRMISLYARRIAVAKADDIVDAWRVLEDIRRRVNDAWGRRGEIAPCYDMREKPPALEIYKRLPGTNCGQCGERTCLAFAVRLWLGETALARCRPVFAGEYRHTKDALTEICAGLGVPEGEPDDPGAQLEGHTAKEHRP